MPALALFKKDSCPYCQKVFRAIDRLGLGGAIEMRDIVEDPAMRDELVRVGGKAQVPCLLIDGAPMYESDDIVAYLEGLA